MGDRATIHITSESFTSPIELYGHWSGTDNAKAVANVLERTGRIGDPTYLTAQLFYEYATILGKYDGNLGFGIRAVAGTPNSLWDDNPVVVVNADTGSVEYDGETYTAEQFALAYADKVS
jgi:hypothetical protein